MPGTIITVAGNGSIGFGGDAGPATSANVYNPLGVAVDTGGNLYIADQNNNRIRKVNPSGIISTLAGNGTQTDTIDGPGGNPADDLGDSGPATSASLTLPTGAAVDSAGNLYIADQGNNRIRKVTPGGTISTVAGNGTAGFTGDGGQASSTSLNQPNAVAVDTAGNLYIADRSNHRVRKVATGGIISTVAGDGTATFAGDGGPAAGAALNLPSGVAVDTAGNLYISDFANSRVRKVDHTTGFISTVAGNGTFGFFGDGGPATVAYLNSPAGLAVDGSGNLYIADFSNQRIRRVNPAGIISTVAGNGTAGFSGDGGSATSASLHLDLSGGGGFGGEPLHRGLVQQPRPRGRWRARPDRHHDAFGQLHAGREREVLYDHGFQLWKCSNQRHGDRC